MSFFFAGNLHGNKIDSLIQLVNKVNGQEKVDALTSLGWELKYSNQSESIKYSVEGLAIARKNGYQANEAELLKNIATVYYLKSEYTRGQEYAFMGLDLFQQLNDVSGIVKTRNIIGLIESNLGNYEKAINEYDKCIVLLQAIGDTTKIIAIESNIANIYFRKGEYQKALPFYERMVAHAQTKGSQEELCINLNNLGMVYTKLGDYPKALKFLYETSRISILLNNHLNWIKSQNEIGLIYRRLEMYQEAIDLYHFALEKAHEIDNQELIASMSNNLGLCYSRIEQLDKALMYYSRSLAIRDSLTISNVGHILHNIGNVHYKKKNYEYALQFFNQALEVNTKLNQKSKIAMVYSDLGKFHLEKNDIPEAEQMLLKSFTIFNETKELKELSTVSQHLIKMYEIKNDKENLSRFKSLNQTYQDSLYNKEKLLSLNKIMVREQIKNHALQTRSSNNTLKAIKDENIFIKQRNNLMLLLFGVLLSILLIWLYFFRKKALTDKTEISQNLTFTQHEKDILKSSIEKKNRDMVLFSLDLVQKENIINLLKSRLSVLLKEQPNNLELRGLINQLRVHDINTKDWTFFTSVFNNTFPDFIKNIKQKYPDLSRKELQHCVLIKLNTPPSQAADILGINTESVHTARYRLRKKMKLNRLESLEDTIQIL